MKTIEVVVRVLDIIIPIVEKKDCETLSFPVDFTFNLVLKRVKANLGTLQVLLIGGVEKHDHAIGLIARNLLTDFITTGYIILLPHDKKETENKLYALHHSDIKKVDSFLEIARTMELINAEKLSELKEHHSEKLYKQVRDYCENNNIKSLVPTGHMIQQFISSDLKDAWSEEIKRSYNIWILYSKYEHLGLSSYEVTKYNTEERINNNLYNVFLNVIIMAASCMEVLNEQSAMKELIELIKPVKEKLYSSY